MAIDQRNAGASTSPTGTYTLDRWYVLASQSSKFTVQQNAGSVTPPAGFTNYLGITSSSAYSILSSDYFLVDQYIEGFNTADLDFGKSTAKTVTLSFWVRSSLTGTFGGVLQNSAVDRSYVFSYSISSANTWEQKSITIAGDTTGTWVGATNGKGMGVRFSFGMGSTYTNTANSWYAGNYDAPTGQTSVVGTNGATFYLTGVQLEVGTQATTFTTAGGSYGAELALCQRYYQVAYGAAGYNGLVGRMYATAGGQGIPLNVFNKVTMRASPTGSIIGSWTTGNCSGVSITGTSQDVAFIYASATASGDAYFYANSASNGYSLSAEL
jgi:hypothetical protein